MTVSYESTLTREKLTCVFASSIIERRLLALLRFKFGEIYTCSASTSLPPGPARGEGVPG